MPRACRTVVRTSVNYSAPGYAHFPCRELAFISLALLTPVGVVVMLGVSDLYVANGLGNMALIPTPKSIVSTGF